MRLAFAVAAHASESQGTGVALEPVLVPDRQTERSTSKEFWAKYVAQKDGPETAVSCSQWHLAGSDPLRPDHYSG